MLRAYSIEASISKLEMWADTQGKTLSLFGVYMSDNVKTITLSADERCKKRLNE